MERDRKHLRRKRIRRGTSPMSRPWSPLSAVSSSIPWPKDQTLRSNKSQININKTKLLVCINDHRDVLIAEFCINDHRDVLVEILRRLDGPSLCSAACVCRMWSEVARNDSIWEELCFQQVIPRPTLSLRSVVSALGGYRCLYFLCIRPVLTRLPKLLWTRDQLQLSLSLYCVHYYERLHVGAWPSDAPPSSLMFLRRPVKVV